MTRRRLAPLAPLTALALLAACGSEPEKAGTNARAEVLEGTITDAMLTTETSQALAPVAASEPEGGDGKDQPGARSTARPASRAKADDAPKAARSPAAEPSPAASPAAAPRDNSDE